MKPTVISNSSASSKTTNPNSSNGINIPIKHDFSSEIGSNSPRNHASMHHNKMPFADSTGTGSPSARAGVGSHQAPLHAQFFNCAPEIDRDEDFFGANRPRRIHHDPFAGFSGSHFDFPEFGSLSRRRVGGGSDYIDDGDFFNRLPSEFRQYMPDSFGSRRGGTNSQGQQTQPPPPQPHQPQSQPHYAPNYAPPPQNFYYQQGGGGGGAGYPSTSGGTPPVADGRMQQPPPSKRLCDAAIQTEDTVDHAMPASMYADNLKQHGLRNTMDMGVKSALQSDFANARAQSAPPPEQQHQQPYPSNVNPQQYGTQTSPQPSNYNAYQQQQQLPKFEKIYVAPQQRQTKQKTPPPPQTPGGSYVRTIPIFVEGRTEPIINSHKEIPNQHAPAAASNAPPPARAYGGGQPQSQSYATPQRPTPLNTQQQSAAQQQHQQDHEAGGSAPPQTPHTVDSINKIQDIQRDVLDLMGKVEKFTGTRQDKEYVYLDEMLTRNLLKLDTIDTNGKESIRLARKEAIKCIQASINVLEAKAEENAKRAAATGNSAGQEATDLKSSNSKEKLVVKTPSADGSLASVAESNQTPSTPQPVDATKIQEPIPLPAPPNTATQSNESQMYATESEGASAVSTSESKDEDNEKK